MRYITFLLLILIGMNGFSQDNEKRKIKDHIGILFSPEYSFRTIQSTSDSWKDTLNHRDQPIFGFQLGVLYAYKFLPWLALETGFKLGKRGYITKIESDFESDGKTVTSFNEKHQNFYIELPVKLDFYFFKKEKIGLFSSLCFTPAYLLQNKQIFSYSYSDGTDRILYLEKNQGMRNFNLHGSIGLGIDIHPIRMLGIRFEPFFRHAFLSDVANTPTFTPNPSHSFQWAFGVRTAVFICF